KWGLVIASEDNMKTQDNIFPRLHRRGPIEAPAVHAHAHRCWVFPRLHRRGPIEATFPVRRLRCLGDDFHAFTGVAPLKHIEYGEAPLGMPYLHAFTGVAPLKPDQARRRTRNGLISTPSQAWPH